MNNNKVDLVESIKFIEDLSKEDSISTLKNKHNQKDIENLMKGIINGLSKGQSVESLEGLDCNQIWSMVNMVSGETIGKYTKFKGKESAFEKELIKATKDYSNKVFNLGRKRLRSKEKEDKGDNDEEIEDKMNEEEDMDEEDEEKDSENNEEKVLEDMMIDDEEDEDIAEDNINLKKKKELKKKDQFFSMNDMNEFADKFEDDNAENNNMNKDINQKEEEEGDNEEEIEENDSKSSVKYEEFFDDVTTSKDNKHSNEIDTENHLFNQIKAIESKMMGPKAWNLKGEVLSSERPKESLLENPMDFEVSIKPPPVPDETYTQALEAIIKLRIKDDLFDDPIRKSRINLNQRDTKHQYELQFSKDDKGLSQIYEDKYNGTEATEGKVDQIKAECEELSNGLFDIFDRLTNENFAPYKTKAKEEMKISNVPSIQIEEISNYVSNNKGYNSNAKELLNTKLIKEKTREELTKEEKQTRHNRKKRNIKTHIHEKERKRKMNQLTQQLGSKFEAKMELKAQKNKQQAKEQKSNEFKSTKVFANIQKMTIDNQSKKTKDTSSTAESNNTKNIKKYKL